MRVLLISPYFPPSGGPQALQSSRLALALYDGDAEVTVLAASVTALQPGNSHRDGKSFDGKGRLKLVRFSTPWWVKLLGRLGAKAYRFFRPEDPWFHLPGLIPALTDLLARERFDVIISIAEPLASHAALQRCRRLVSRNTRLVYWFSDPVPLAQFSSQMKLACRRRKIERLIESCRRDAQALVAVTPEILEPISPSDAARPPRFVIPHSFDPLDWPWPPKPAAGGDAGRVAILHSGALYWTRHPFVLLEGVREFARKAPEAGPITVRLQGSISTEIAAKVSAARMPFSLEVAGPGDFEDSKSAMAAADILCVIDVDLPRNVHLPSKVADCVGACKPILYIGRPDSPTCRLLKGAHPAFAQAGTPGEVADAIESLMRAHEQVRLSDYETIYRRLSSRVVYDDLMRHLSMRSVMGTLK
jgi:hypothetical protein